MKDLLKKIKKCVYLLNNYNYRSINELQAYEKKYKISKEEKALMRNWPINGNYERIFNDIVASRKVLFNDFHFSNQLIRVENVLKKKTFKKIISNTEIVISFNEVKEILESKRNLIVRDSLNSIKTKVYEIVYSNNEIVLNGELITMEDYENFLCSLPRYYVIYEKKESAKLLKEYTGFQEPLLHIVYFNMNGCCFKKMYYVEHNLSGKPVIYNFIQSDLSIKDDIGGTREAISDFDRFVTKFQDIKYINIAFRILEDGYELVQIDTGLDLMFATGTTNKIKRCFIEQKRNKESIVKILFKYGFSWVAKKNGFLDYMYKYWLRVLYEDIKTHTCTLRELVWANRRGFYSYRIEQYKLTNENYKEFLSDRSYKRMRPINSKYYRLLTDKLITYYLLSNDFKEYLPKYYGKLSCDDKKLKVYEINSSGCTSFDNLIKILYKEKKLICKKIIGSHGEGFIRLEVFDDETIRVNENLLKFNELYNMLIKNDADYIITEYIEIHDDLKNMCNNVTSTIRIMTINISDSGNKVKDAYFRIATKKTGLTDNVALGGVVAKVNKNSGEIYNAELLSNHKYITCESHPDNQEIISGIIPHWDVIVKTINEICIFLSEIEYLGFDVVVTNEGFKILEINTHQDLHKYSDYPDEVKCYLKSYL